MDCKKHFYLLHFSFLTFLMLPATLYALPFNDDMVHDQYKVSEVMRDGTKGTVAVGSLARSVKDRTEGLTLKNPIPFTEGSIARGKRLWDVNCTPCHGRYTGKAHPEFKTMAVFEKPIDPLVASATSGPQLVSKAYIEDPSKTDGHIYSYIYFGGLAIMPRYGYKLAPSEIWDMVNYIRYMQEDFKKLLGDIVSDKSEDSDKTNSETE